ncbi:hypothetical protein ACFYVR_20430 [Rhodococcus sp. NPDC003318]|uniref:hypothetical protein n=1 Tax=Rhodococcus sp. NPDC003318 TaxID=3364503 RepID=UPI0036A1CC49
MSAFGPGVPVAAVLGAADPDPAPTAPPAPGHDHEGVAVATAANRSGTVTVTATDRGLPLDLRIDPREMRYGGEALAVAILDVGRAATVSARLRRREDLAEAGVPTPVLEDLGLPAPDQSAPDPGSVPHTWMKPL